ncbi:MAG: hypothetical protein SWQ30_07845 [Thermodesulfobacteriota bacterium]|nr:hypothetical protein [Thermodesulfobacteriota bacterium]
MIEDIFLAYANNSFRDDPKNVFKVFGEILPCVSPDRVGIHSGYLNYLLDRLVFFANCNGPEEAKSPQEVHPIYQYFHLDDIAYEAVYAYRNGFCENPEDGCRWSREWNLDQLRRKGLIGEDRLKCFECVQLRFIDVLSDIVEGKEYLDLMGSIVVDDKWQSLLRSWGHSYRIGERVRTTGNLERMLTEASHCVSMELELGNNGPEKRFYVNTTDLFKGKALADTEEVDFRFVFVDFMSGIAGYSLAEFLTKNDRRKLKRCKECGVFFKSKTTRKADFCSDPCRWNWHNRTRIESGEAREYKRKRRQMGLDQ